MGKMEERKRRQMSATSKLNNKQFEIQLIIIILNILKERARSIAFNCIAVAACAAISLTHRNWRRHHITHSHITYNSMRIVGSRIRADSWHSIPRGGRMNADGCVSFSQFRRNKDSCKRLCAISFKIQNELHMKCDKNKINCLIKIIGTKLPSLAQRSWDPINRLIEWNAFVVVVWSITEQSQMEFDLTKFAPMNRFLELFGWRRLTWLGGERMDGMGNKLCREIVANNVNINEMLIWCAVCRVRCA